MKLRIILILNAVMLLSCSLNKQNSDAYGNFEAKEVIVSAEAQGRVTDYKIELGQQLRQGEIAGYIDSVQTDLKKEQLLAQKRLSATKFENIDAQANVQKEQLKALQTEQERIRKLLADGVATQRQLDDINGKMKVVESQISSIEVQKNSVTQELATFDKQISSVSDLLKKNTIINPIDGTVLQKYIENKELAVPGKPLYKIADLRNMELKVYVSGKQLSSIRIGDEVTVLVDKNDKEYNRMNGKIIWVSSNAEFTPKIIQTKEERVNLVYAVKVSVINDGTLKIGMPGEIIIKK